MTAILAGVTRRIAPSPVNERHAREGGRFCACGAPIWRRLVNRNGMYSMPVRPGGRLIGENGDECRACHLAHRVTGRDHFIPGDGGVESKVEGNAWHATCRGCGGSGLDADDDAAPCFYCRGDGRFDVFNARDQDTLEQMLADDRLWSIREIRDEPRHNNGDGYFLAYVRSVLSNQLPTAPHSDMPNVAGAADARVGHTVPPILGGWNTENAQ